MARPTLYTKELGDELCLRIATSERSLRRICREDDDMPCIATVMNWLKDKDKAEFLEQYARSKEEQADYMADKTLEIADSMDEDVIKKEDGTEVVNYNVIARDKLRVDTRKWLLSKMMPKKYGEFQRTEIQAAVETKEVQTFTIGGKEITF